MKYFSPVFWLLKLLAIIKASIQFQIAEEEDLPVHHFTIKEQLIKSGKNKGSKKFIVNLVIPPYTFKRKCDAPTEGKNAIFSCIQCELDGYKVYAKALKKFTLEPKPEYCLVQWPTSDAHHCVQSTTTHLVKAFMSQIQEAVKAKPWMSVASIYKDIRSEISATLKEDEKITFFIEIPSYASCSGNLYRFRNEFIPKQPESVVSFFNLKGSSVNP